MTLPQKINLIDALIRENRDVTVGEYLFALAEIENVEKSSDMGSRLNCKNVTDQEKSMILAMAKEDVPPMTIAKKMGVHFTVVYRLCKQKAGGIREIRHPGVTSKRGPVPDMPEVKKIARPAAEYSNRSPMGIATEFNNQKAAI